jgi:protein-S-isoprenylcysteine O-methyltransferase Ste14
MFNSVFKILYFIGFILISVVRTTHTAKYRTLRIAIDRKSSLDIVLLALAGIGMLVPLIYVFSSLLDFANYSLPHWAGWLGAILFAVAIWLLWRSHVDLGRNWTPTLGIRADHQLVTDGVFKYVRHPMYAAHLLWAIAQVLMLHNWIAGYSFLVVSVPHYLLRVKAEEQMMLEQFGEQYESYMQRTGRIIPRIKVRAVRYDNRHRSL